MEKVASQDRKFPKPITEAVAPMVVAVAGPLLVILLAGYITMQLQLVEAHGFTGFNDRFISVAGDWLRYLWPAVLVVLVVAAVLIYRAAVRSAAARFTALGVFALVAMLAIPMASGPRLNPDEHYPLMTYIAMEGAKSPLVLALIGALVADLIASRGMHPRRASV